MYSPWGEIQESDKLDNGCRFVFTAGHGGFMLTEKFAKENLTPEALACADVYNHYYCYEEDCNYAIVAYELFDLVSKTMTVTKEDLLVSLTRWNSKYLIARGIPLMPDDTFRLFVDAGTFVIPCENKMDSFGYLDGRTVVVDYGN